MTTTGRIIEQLAADLKPAPPTPPARLALLLLLVVAVQAAVAFGLGEVRRDLAAGAPSAILLWRITASLALAAIATTVVLRLRSPVARPGGWAALALAVALAAVSAGWILDLAAIDTAALLGRLRVRSGLHCVAVVMANGLPVLLLLTLGLRRGATVRPEAAAAWSGLAAAATGGVIWALACPIDDPVYATFWYALAFGFAALLSRLLLVPVIRLRPPRRPIG